MGYGAVIGHEAKLDIDPVRYKVSASRTERGSIRVDGAGGHGSEETGMAMEYEDERQAFTFIAGIALGTLIGAGVALLIAPQSGQRTRRQIARAAEDLGDTARDRFGDAGDEVRRRARRAKRAAERRGQRLRDSIGRREDEDDEDDED